MPIIHNQYFFSLLSRLPKRPISGRNRKLIGSPYLLSTISLDVPIPVGDGNGGRKTSTNISKKVIEMCSFFFLKKNAISFDRMNTFYYSYLRIRIDGKKYNIENRREKSSHSSTIDPVTKVFMRKWTEQ